MSQHVDPYRFLTENQERFIRDSGGRKVSKVDARSQTRDQLEQRRKDVVRLYQDGVPVMQIADCIGLGWSAVNEAIQLFKVGGESALKPAARGRKQGNGRKLTDEQAAETRRLIRLKRPWFYKLKDSLWSRKTVSELIDKRLGVQLSDRVANKYLNSWGIETKRGGKQAPERCSQEVREWLDIRYSLVEEQAHKEGATIYWLNKPLRLDAALWPPSRKVTLQTFEAAEASDQVAKGEGEGVAEFEEWEGEHLEADDLIELPSRPLETEVPRKVRLISAVKNNGAALWMVTTDSFFGALGQIRFMKTLIKHTPTKRLYLIRYDLNSYNSQQIESWIKPEGASITIFPNTNLLYNN